MEIVFNDKMCKEIDDIYEKEKELIFDCYTGNSYRNDYVNHADVNTLIDLMEDYQEELTELMDEIFYKIEDVISDYEVKRIDIKNKYINDIKSWQRRMHK